MNNVPSDFKFNFNEEQQKRKEKQDQLGQAFWEKGHWVDQAVHREQLVSIAEEFELDNSTLVAYWRSCFPAERTVVVPHPANATLSQRKCPVSDRADKFDEFRSFVSKHARERKEREAHAELHASRMKPYQYIAGDSNYRHSDTYYPPPSPTYEGAYDKEGRGTGYTVDTCKLVQGRAVIDKLFDLVERAEKAEVDRERLLEELRGLRADFGGVRRPADSGNADNTFYTACLVEHAEKAEEGRERLLEELRGLRADFGGVRQPADSSNADSTLYTAYLVEHAAELKTTNYSLVEHAEKAELGREKTVLGLERLLEELRGLRLELGSLKRPANSNADRAFYIACACLGVLILMLFFK